MVNFNIIDGEYDNFNIIDDFVKLYNNPNYTVPMIREHFNMSYGEYTRIRRYCVEKGLINGDKMRYTIRTSKYIHNKKNGKYQIWNKINNKKCSFGTYDLFSIAKKIVIELIKVDWDKNELERIKKEVM